MCVCSSLAAQSAWRDMTGRRHGFRGGWSCSGYLRTSRREALNFLPRSHSIGLGLSHLQCKAERMRRERDGREGEEEWESTALTLTLSTLALALADLEYPAEEKREMGNPEDRWGHCLLQSPSARRPEATEWKGGWTAHIAANDGVQLITSCTFTNWRFSSGRSDESHCLWERRPTEEMKAGRPDLKRSALCLP